MIALTGRQADVLDSIRHHLSTKGYPPTIRELCGAIGIRSTNGVNDHLKALERKGYLTRASDAKSRGLQLTPKAGAPRAAPPPEQPEAGPVKVDVYERLPAGAEPFLPHHVVETVTVDRAMVRNARHPFGVRMRGDSMVDAGLLDGDTVLFSRQSDVVRGELVCVVAGDEAVLRHIYPERDYVRLQPASTTVPPLLVRSIDWHPRLILGAARGMLRRIAYVA
jgi:repressor LexA